MTEKNVTTGQKVYITKFALTTGIQERIAIENQDLMLIYEDFEACNKRGVVFRDDWRTTLEDAHNQVLKMIAAKRKSIAKQLKKLDQLEAEIKAEQGSEMT